MDKYIGHGAPVSFSARSSVSYISGLENDNLSTSLPHASGLDSPISRRSTSAIHLVIADPSSQSRLGTCNALRRASNEVCMQACRYAGMHVGRNFFRNCEGRGEGVRLVKGADRAGIRLRGDP
jgi:hypothetical protein